MTKAAQSKTSQRPPWNFSKAATNSSWLFTLLLLGGDRNGVHLTRPFPIWTPTLPPNTPLSPSQHYSQTEVLAAGPHLTGTANCGQRVYKYRTCDLLLEPVLYKYRTCDLLLEPVLYKYRACDLLLYQLSLTL